jgi:DNA-directed RNA polymerase specialized sigma subunit
MWSYHLRPCSILPLFWAKFGYEEALQAGRIGLWHAIRGYDPARGTAFSTYAWVAIYRQIHRRAKELRRETDLGSHVFDKLKEGHLARF